MSDELTDLLRESKRIKENSFIVKCIDCKTRLRSSDAADNFCYMCIKKRWKKKNKK